MDLLLKPARSRSFVILIGVYGLLISSAVVAEIVARTPGILTTMVQQTALDTAITFGIADTNGVNIGSLNIMNNASNGQVQASGSQITYTPNLNFTGQDTFTYEIDENDWRTGSPGLVTLSASDAAPTVSVYTDGAGSHPIFAATALTGAWIDTSSSSSVSGVIGRVVAYDPTSGNLTGCNAGDTTSPLVRMQAIWNVQRSSGTQGGYEASITADTNPVHPISPSNPDYLIDDRSGNFSINNPVSVVLDIPDMTLIDFQTPQKFGLWVQGRDKLINNNWISNSATIMAGLNTEPCSLTVTVTVTVQVGLDFDNEPGEIANLDEDNDGIADKLEGTEDSDNDGIANYLDLDSDNDGITDIIEAGGIDANGDGQIDSPTDANNDGQDDNVQLANTDLDEDGLPNTQDVDSNGDDTMDIAETDKASSDADGDGVIDAFFDVESLLEEQNQDGLHDVFTGANKATPTDSDDDSIPDFREEVKSSGGSGFLGVPVLVLLIMAVVYRRKL